MYDTINTINTAVVSRTGDKTRGNVIIFANLNQHGLQAGSSIQSQVASESNVHAVFERPSNFAHLFNAPLPSLLRMGYFVFVFFARYLGFSFLGHLGLTWDNIGKRLGRGTLNTCAKFQGLISQKRRGHLDFSAV